MAETKSTGAATARHAASADSRYQALRGLGARAHQLRAVTRAADRFIARDQAEDSDTATWLISTAVGLAAEVAAELDALGLSMKDTPAEPALASRLIALRKRAHELHAACRAADHFLEQESTEDRDTGSWLASCAFAVADKLSGEIDDSAGALRRPGGDAATSAIDAADASLLRRVAAATPMRA